MPFLILLFCLTILILGTGYILYRIAFYPKRYSPFEVIKAEIDYGKLKSLDEFNSWQCVELQIDSPFGYPLSGAFYPLDGSRKTIILSHGITINRYGSVKYMALFRRLGFNILIYDNRYHGKSGGGFCSFGFFEKHDLKAVVDWVIARVGTGAFIGTHGESLGAAITLQHAAIDPRIRFAIADCGWSDLAALYRLRMHKDYHLPEFPLLQIARWYGKWLLHFDFHEASPIRTIAGVDKPVLLIHGDQDRYIPPEMSVELYNRKKSGVARLYLAKGGGHAEAYFVDPLEYERQISLFLKEIGE